MSEFKLEKHEIPFHKELLQIFRNDADVLVEKGRAYGDSWRKRGGAGAYMVIARKWDRLEEFVKNFGYDVFKAYEEDTRKEGVIEDIADLRRYLAILEHHLKRCVWKEMASKGSLPDPDACPYCGNKEIVIDGTNWPPDENIDPIGAAVFNELHANQDNLVQQADELITQAVHAMRSVSGRITPLEDPRTYTHETAISQEGPYVKLRLADDGNVVCAECGAVYSANYEVEHKEGCELNALNKEFQRQQKLGEQI